MTLPFQCQATHSRFLTLSTCISRRAHAQSHTAVSIGFLLEQKANYEPCRDCHGPIRIEDGVQVEITPKMPPKRGYGASGLPDTLKSIHEWKAARRRKEYNRAEKPPSLEAQYRALKPEDPWTYTVCKCVKTRADGNRPQTCRECIRGVKREQARRYREKKGIQKRKSATGLCSVEGCSNPHKAKGLCTEHYRIEYRKTHSRGKYKDKPYQRDWRARQKQKSNESK